MEEKVTPFWMEEYFTTGMCNWSLCLMFIQRIEKSVWELSGLLTTNIINEKIYKVWTINMSNFLNQFLQVLLGPDPNIILTIPFWSKKTLWVAVEVPQNIIPVLSMYEREQNMWPSMFLSLVYKIVFSWQNIHYPTYLVKSLCKSHMWGGYPIANK